MHTIILVPAYGRSYVDMRTALSDWQAGKDFRIVSGPYASIRDIEDMQKRHTCVFILLPNLSLSMRVDSH